MSVFTEVGHDQLETFLQQYQVGTLKQYKGISAGIENTNYFVDTDSDQFVLTLFEHQTIAELEYCVGLMATLADAGVPTAHPIAGNDGKFLRVLAGKPAALVCRLQGKAVTDPTVAQCGELGRVLAEFHLAGDRYPLSQPDLRGSDWLAVTGDKVTSKLPADQAELLQAELKQQLALDKAELPQGVIHADLFRDNALFENGNLLGVIDLYAACNDALLYDIAVCVNDWCTEADGSVDPQRAQSLLSSYGQQRTITDLERRMWPMMLRRAHFDSGSPACTTNTSPAPANSLAFSTPTSFYPYCVTASNTLS
ncbi:MAG: homoserine kinase [Immundisolibacteraceae bacterium]|nr:homoserine kinase [Immundisolibacteraceae bacterium]